MPATSSHSWFEVAQVGAITVVKFTGPSLVDEEAIQAIGKRLVSLAEAGGQRCFVVNLEAVTLMASLMVAKLLGFHRKVRTAGGRLALCAIAPDLYRVFERTQLTKVFVICATEQEAVQSV
jgi:anti-anti-sigma factor